MLLLTASLSVSAAPRSLAEARAAAKQLLNRHAALKAPGHSVTAAEPHLVAQAQRSADEAYYYVFAAGTNQGYALISGDDRMPIVVGYADSGDYAEANLPDALKAVLGQYRDFLDTATPEEIAEAQALRRAPAHTAVPYYVQTKWNQYAPYNNMCPEYAEGKRAVTGCVATAAAQVLGYYKHPAQLQANIAAYTANSKSNTKPHIDMPAIDAGEAYDWTNIINVYKKDEYTAEQGNAVAKLMLHVGCSVKMNYYSSSAASATVTTFTKYFGMDKETTREVKRSDYNISDWDHTLYAEIAAQRPVYYTGQSTGGGHAFIIDGYEDGLYHVNWGWGGSSDGFFDITILNPKNTTEAGASSTSDGYSSSNDMIIGLQPDNGVVDEPTWPVFTARELSNDSISALTYYNGVVTAKVTNASVRNNNSKEYARFVSIAYRDAAGSIVNAATPQKITIKGLQNSKIQLKKFSTDLSFAAEAGKSYDLFIVESSDSTTWIECKHKSGSQTLLTINVTADAATLAPHTAADITAMAEFDTTSSRNPMEENAVNVTVTNTGDDEYCGKIYVYFSPTDSIPSEAYYETGITAPAKGSTTFNFLYKPELGGNCNVWIKAGSTLIGQSRLAFTTATEPKIKITSIKVTNATDTKVFGPYSNKTVQMSQVNDTVAHYEFTLTNYGTAYTGKFKLTRWHGSSTNKTVTEETLTLPENAKTTFAYDVVGEAGEVAYAKLDTVSVDKADTISSLFPSTINHLVKESGNYYMARNYELCYLAGNGAAPDPTPSDEPQLSFVSIRCTNASEETAYAPYKTYDEVAFPKVYDTKAVIEFVVRNDGAEYEGEFKIDRYNPESGKYKVSRETLKFPVGETTYTFTAEGEVGKLAGVWLTSDDISISPLEGSNRLRHAINGKTSVYYFDDRELVYLAGAASAIESVTTTAASAAPCYNLNGQRVGAAARGIVIQNGRKSVRR